jgi:hypothetical protein
MNEFRRELALCRAACEETRKLSLRQREISTALRPMIPQSVAAGFVWKFQSKADGKSEAPSTGREGSPSRDEVPSRGARR